MSPVCIVCLAGNVDLHRRINIELLQLYGKLANTKLNADGRPKTMCYNCHEQLERCQNFSVMAQRSAKILGELVKKGIEVTHEKIIALNLELKQNIAMNDQPSVSADDKIYIKQEPSNQIVPVEFEPEETRKQDKESGILIKEEYESDCDKDEDMTEDSNSNRGREKQDQETKIVRNLDTERQNQETTKKHNNKIHACNDCAKVFTDIKQLQEHLKTHAGKKPFVCRICSKIFPFQDNLSKHFKTHPGEKPYACEFCDKAFQRIIDLKQHIVLLHNGEKAPVNSTAKLLTKRHSKRK